MPNDGGNLIIEADEYDDFIANEPLALPYIKRFVMGEEFINNLLRYCLWLDGIAPSELKKMRLVLERVEKCRLKRESSTREATRKLATSPTLFGEIRQPKEKYIAIPAVSSERRQYIPIAFLEADVIAGNKVFTIANAELYHFGILTSDVHMAWVRTVCGRLKSDYNYSNTIVYNNFPWPNPTDKQRQAIEVAAQGVLDIRQPYLDRGESLAQLYDPNLMPPELAKAHRTLDSAVKKAYGGKGFASEAERVADLMERYQLLIQK